jgi:hypothetical protein
MDNILGSIQNEYFELLMKYKYSMENDFNLDLMFIITDEVHKFWLKRISTIDKEIDIITKNDYSMLLSGAIYLDYNDNDHYVYKSLGNYHFLHDSIIKLEGMIRTPKESIDFKKLGGLMKKAYNDEILVLKNVLNHFTYVPFMIMPHNIFENETELVHNTFLNIISSFFDMKFYSEDDFYKLFNSYEEIEKKINPQKLKHIITLDENDIRMPLRKRIENYLNAMPGGQHLLQHDSDSSRFLFTMFSFTNQVLDILLTCTYYNLTPFIRYNITFHYFVLLMYNFSSDDTIRKKIEDAIITYIFYHHIEKSKLSTIKFSEYCKIIKNYNFFKNIREELEMVQINIFSSELKKLIKIVDGKINEFYNVIDNK